MPNVRGRTIGTADAGGVEVVIIGWIFPRGCAGPIALVNNARYILFTLFSGGRTEWVHIVLQGALYVCYQFYVMV